MPLPNSSIGESITPRTDIYSLGLVIYEMLTGEHPFSNLSNEEMRYKRLNEPLPSLRESNLEFPSILDDVIQKLQQRIQTNDIQMYSV